MHRAPHAEIGERLGQRVALRVANGEEVILASSKFDSDDDCCFASPTRPTTWGALKSHYR